MRRIQGSITIFLSLILLSILALICVCLESARAAGLQASAQMCAVSSLQSVLAGYDRILWEQYGLFFFSDSDREGTRLVQIAKDYAEKNGNAEASGQRYAASYRAVYSGTVSLPDVPGYDAVATYTGTVQQPTGETEYTVKAAASYERLEKEEKAEIPSQPGTGLTPIQIILISVGAFLFLVLIVGLLWILAKQKKKKQTKKEF